MEELDKAEHGDGDPMISLGLAEAGDMNLNTWNASILCQGGAGGFGKFDGRFLEIRIVCGENYPA